MPADQAAPTVFIVDDDEAVRDSLLLLVRSVGLAARAFPDAAEFLDRYEPDRPGCLVLDIRMPGISGIELQERLNQLHSPLPIIFITGHGDVPTAVRAMRGGAVDFLEKPFSDQELLDRIQEALERAAAGHRSRTERRTIRNRLDTLSRRESEVLAHVVRGAANKVIANRLGLSPRTVEIHRAHIMRKMQARSLAELVRMVVAAE